MKNVTIGIDLHKNTSTYCVKNKEGEILETDTFKTQEKNFEKLSYKYKGATVVIEPVSESWYFGDILEDLGFEVKLAHSRHVSALGKVKAKTDTNDAMLLCNLSLAGILPEAYRTSRSMRDVKELVRTRHRLIRIRGSYKNIIHSILRKYGLKAPYQNMFGVRGLSWIEEKEKVFGKCTGLALQTFLSEVFDLNEKIEEIEKEMIRIGEKCIDYELLNTIPGIGPIGSLTIITEIENIHRFQSEKHFVSFCGLAPNTIASGDKSHHGKLRKGNTYLRFTLIQAAQHQKRLRDNKGLRLFYERMKEHKDKNTATVATARKIGKIVYSMLANNVSFNQRKINEQEAVISTCA